MFSSVTVKDIKSIWLHAWFLPYANEWLWVLWMLTRLEYEITLIFDCMYLNDEQLWINYYLFNNVYSKFLFWFEI